MTLLQSTNPHNIRIAPSANINSPADVPMHVDPQANCRHSHQAFENTSTNVAASQMRNALNDLTDTVKDEKLRKVRTNAANLKI
jgi:hypothetical protein